MKQQAGEKVTVGPVEYIISFEGTHEGSKEVVPENTFVMIGITAKNISDEKTLFQEDNSTLLMKKSKNTRQFMENFHQKTYC